MMDGKRFDGGMAGCLVRTGMRPTVYVLCGDKSPLNRHWMEGMSVGEDCTVHSRSSSSFVRYATACEYMGIILHSYSRLHTPISISPSLSCGARSMTAALSITSISHPDCFHSLLSGSFSRPLSHPPVYVRRVDNRMHVVRSFRAHKSHMVEHGS